MIMIKDDTHLKVCENRVKNFVHNLSKTLHCHVLDVRSMNDEKKMFFEVKRYKEKEEPFILLTGDKNSQAERTIFKYLIRTPHKFKIESYELATPNKKIAEVLKILDFTCLWCKHVSFKKRSDMPICRSKKSKCFGSKRRLEDFVPECFELNYDYLKRKDIF